MRNKIYISKKLVVRLLFFIAVVSSAILFDIYHEDDKTIVSETNKAPDSTENGSTHFFYCTTTNPVNIKDSGSFESRNLFQRNQDKFLQIFHNHKAFFKLKSESLITRLPIALSVHYVVFNKCHYSSPDDYTPVA